MDTQIENLPILILVYKLSIGDKWYIGSTQTDIAMRMATHYKQGLLTPNRKLYKAVADGGGWKEVKCEILEAFPFTTQDERMVKEKSYIQLTNENCLNTKMTILTSEERIEMKKASEKKSKKKLYEKQRQDPEWVAKQRQRAKDTYERSKSDPDFMERKRRIALASYYRRKKNVEEPPF